MKKQDKTKVREKLDVELKEYQKLSRVHRSGRPWLREIRQALGMSVTELAYRLDCSRSLVYRIEEGESRGVYRVDVLKYVAEAMNCRLVYAIVPRNGETLATTAKCLKENPQWRTEKQEARKKKEIDEYRARLNREHWELIREQKAERVRAMRRAETAQKLAEEWAADKAKSAAESAARDAAGAARKAPVEWWTARTAETMRKEGVPADVALKMALERLKNAAAGKAAV